MRLIDADRLKEDIANLMPARVEVFLVIDSQPDALALLKDQEERIKTLEHQLETITKWRANAGAFD